MSSRVDHRAKITDTLKAFASKPIPDAAKELLQVLGYASQRTLPIHSPGQFLKELDPDHRLTERDRDAFSEVISLQLLFQFTDRELTAQKDLFDSGTGVETTQIQSYLFFAVELSNGDYTRSVMSALLRAINKPLPMPAIVLFKHGLTVSMGIIHRRLNKRDRSRDVLEKVTLVKDIHYDDPIRAHVEILNDFAFENLNADFGVGNFVQLHEAWQKRLGSYALSNDFYREIADWYFWAHHQVEDGSIRLPKHCDTEQEQSLFLIRLLTRVIFCWFLVEKRLIPNELFRERWLRANLKKFTPGKTADTLDTSPTFYHAILQNLFFGTLNMPTENRAFREKKKEGERYDKNYGITNLWRYEADFRCPSVWISICERIPFLNGGLFDCLDDKIGHKDDNFLLDGFSDNAKFSCLLPNDLFFGPERTVDLSKDYGEEGKKTARSKRAKVRGLIEILSRYKFTVEENTPLEEEIALDPELLGKVFENLLASYNEDTKTTARKALGAFYTPREIVNYMVDESLKSYLSTQVPRCNGALEDLFSIKATLKEIRPETRDALIEAIGRVKILDPACGSGAFPMGALHRLVDLLQKLDPENVKWRELQRLRAVAETDNAFKSGDRDTREQRLKEINDTFEFNSSDYGRKLYLIENSIYGVDIQPIATQIAKLRFFIALIVEQKVSPDKDNLGVLPLPNLETRLVAANTLIPIEKSERDLFSSEIDRLRAELGMIRHEHFNARNPTTKKRWREADAQKRQEIGDYLKREHTIPPESADLLATWDPYDQNVFAPFFDCEWMFGFPVGKVRSEKQSYATLTNRFAFYNELPGQKELVANQEFELDSGFDIVIGNPPYGVKFPSDRKRYLSSLYNQASRIPDSYAFFILRGLEVLRPGGALTFIVPNTFCDLENADDFRRHLLTHVSIDSIWQSGWVFNAAVVDTLVLVAEASVPSPQHEVLVITDTNKDRRKQAAFLDAPLAKIDFRSSKSSLTLKDRIRRHTKPLSEHFLVKAGVKMYEVGKGDPPQSRSVVASKPFSRTGDCPHGWKMLYRGGDIAPFFLADSGERVNYGPWLAAPRSAELFSGPKILMRRTDDRLRCSLDLTDAICVNSCHIIKLHELGNDALSRYHATVGVLNSRVCQWIFEADNPQMVGKTFAEIKVVYVERLPLPHVSVEQSMGLTRLVKILLFLNEEFKNRRESNTREQLMLSYWERVLNGLVYELYFPEEVQIAGLRMFDLVDRANLPEINIFTEAERVPTLWEKFEDLYTPSHRIRIALDKLQTLDFVRIIEGNA